MATSKKTSSNQVRTKKSKQPKISSDLKSALLWLFPLGVVRFTVIEKKQADFVKLSKDWEKRNTKIVVLDESISKLMKEQASLEKKMGKMVK